MKRQRQSVFRQPTRTMARCFSTSIVLLYLALFAVGQEAAPELLQVPQDAAKNLILKRVSPVYPPLARQARIQGTVILNITITKEGDVRALQLVSGHPMLAPAAIEAVKQWKYRPYEQDGQPAGFQTTVQVNFKLPDSPPPADGIAGDGPPGLSPMQSIVDPVRVCEPQLNDSDPKRVRVSSAVMRTLMTKKKNPVYPDDARSQHIEGNVMLAIEIGRDGAVCDITLISGHPLLAPAAMDAARQWKYKPYLLNGQPIEVETLAQVNFTLRP